MSRFDKFPQQKIHTTQFNAGKLKGFKNGFPPDNGLLTYLKKINRNPDVAVFSSDSGHDGHAPYIWIYFRSTGAESRYISQFRTSGYMINPVGDNGSDGIHIAGRNEGGKFSKKFWDNVTQILSR